jgi:hypothetical protein
MFLLSQKARVIGGQRINQRNQCIARFIEPDMLEVCIERAETSGAYLFAEARRHEPFLPVPQIEAEGLEGKLLDLFKLARLYLGSCRHIQDRIRHRRRFRKCL